MSRGVLFMLSLPFGILTAIGFVLASFLLWRNLKADFPEEEILSFTLWLALAGVLGGRLGWVFFHYPLFFQNLSVLLFWIRFPGFSLLGVVLGILGAWGVWGKKKDWDLWLVLDQLVVAGLPLFVLGSVGAYLTNREVFYLGLGAVGVLGVIVQRLCLVNYRSFLFYPSGKVGFIGLTSLALFFSLILALDFFKKDGLLLERTGYLVIILVALGLLYQRSGRKRGEDLRRLKLSLLAGRQETKTPA